MVVGCVWVIYLGFGLYLLGFGSFLSVLDHLLVLDHIHLPLDHLCNFWIISTCLWIIYVIFRSYAPYFQSYSSILHQFLISNRYKSCSSLTSKAEYQKTGGITSACLLMLIIIKTSFVFF